MAPTKRTTREDFGGMDPAFMIHIMSKIPRNSLTGKVDMVEIMKYMQEHPDEMEKLMAESEKNNVGKLTVDLTKYDYQALARTIVHESFWVIQLEHVGFVDKNGREVDPARAHTSTGVKPAFMIYCYDDRNRYRLTKDCTGLPDSKTVLEAIQQAIADPIIPLKPCLPWFLLISIKFIAHEEALKPFLDSLPAPFHWRYETRQEAEGVRDGVHELNQQGVKMSMSLAEKLKTAGNQAFAKKDRKAALNAYTEALSHVVDALAQNPDIQEEGKAIRLRAMCFANRAAAHLIPGEGMDAKKALEDGQDAERVDPSYAKGYIRQAAANEALGNNDGAQDSILRALQREDLENESTLVDRLLELMTDGQGIPKETTLQEWFAKNPAKSDRVKGVKGDLQRRLSAA